MAPGMRRCIVFAVQAPELNLCALQHFAARCAQLAATTVDIEAEHRHRRAEWRTLASAAVFCRSLQRNCDIVGAALGKNAALERERIAFARYARRPSCLGFFAHRSTLHNSVRSTLAAAA